MRSVVNLLLSSVAYLYPLKAAPNYLFQNLNQPSQERTTLHQPSTVEQ